jgi:L-amino acid N-acyltransferase YncA
MSPVIVFPVRAAKGGFRGWPAYQYTVEHSIYIHKDRRGAGLGRELLEALVAAAREGDVHTMAGGIDVENAASISLHQHLGFEHAGTIRQPAFKFNRWLDLRAPCGLDCRRNRRGFPGPCRGAVRPIRRSVRAE